MERRRKLAFDMYKLMGVDRKDPASRLQALMKNFSFFGAPVGLFITVDRICDRNGWGHVGMFIQSLCLLAEEAGLATCLQEAWANWSKLVSNQLQIPDSEILWCGIALGYADLNDPVNTLQSDRLSLSEFVTFIGPSSKL